MHLFLLHMEYNSIMVCKVMRLEPPKQLLAY